MEGKSRTIRTDFTSRIDLNRRTDFTGLQRKDQDWIKARKADGAELRDWPPQASAESPYELRSKSKVQQKKTEFSEIIVKMAKAMLVVEVEEELELEQGEF